VPGVASVQAKAPARREDGREFQALGPDEQKDRSATVFNYSVNSCTINSPLSRFNPCGKSFAMAKTKIYQLTQTKTCSFRSRIQTIGSRNDKRHH